MWERCVLHSSASDTGKQTIWWHLVWELSLSPDAAIVSFCLPGSHMLGDGLTPTGSRRWVGSVEQCHEQVVCWMPNMYFNGPPGKQAHSKKRARKQREREICKSLTPGRLIHISATRGEWQTAEDCRSLRSDLGILRSGQRSGYSLGQVWLCVGSLFLTGTPEASVAPPQGALLDTGFPNCPQPVKLQYHRYMIICLYTTLCLCLYTESIIFFIPKSKLSPHCDLVPTEKRAVCRTGCNCLLGFASISSSQNKLITSSSSVPTSQKKTMRNEKPKNQNFKPDQKHL